MLVYSADLVEKQEIYRRKDVECYPLHFVDFVCLQLDAFGNNNITVLFTLISYYFGCDGIYALPYRRHVIAVTTSLALRMTNYNNFPFISVFTTDVYYNGMILDVIN